MLRDFRAKVARAAEVEGFRFLHVLGAVPARLAVPDRAARPRSRGSPSSPRTFPLFEVDDGSWRDHVPAEARAARGRAALVTQGRFAHLDERQIAAIQGHVDARWERLTALATG